MVRRISRLAGIALLASFVSYCSLSLAASIVTLTHETSAQQEKRYLAAVFRALGYYSATITLGQQLRQARFGPLPENAIQPLGWQIVAGPLYKIGWVELRGIGGLNLSADVQSDLADLLARYPGLPARAVTFGAMEDEVLWRLLRASYPFATINMRSIVPDQTSRTVTVRMNVDAGMQARFGAVSFKGLRRVTNEKLMDKITFSAGDMFDPLKLQRFGQSLEKMALFQDVSVRYAEKADAAGRLPVEVRVREHGIAGEILETTASKGMITTLLALGLLSLNQVALAGGAPRRVTRPIALLCLILLIAGAVFALQRVASLLPTL
ncbi:MAG: hypothetical protein WCC66_01965 [Rhizobiaceae bacterium]